MKNPIVISLLSGILFGVGLSLSQMTNPNKIIDFLDITGNWDPSLALVMLGALSVTFISFKKILNRPKPLLENHFHLSKKTEIDRSLIVGATIFGIGWGISGYCPGAAVASIGLGIVEAFAVALSIYAGIFFQRWISYQRANK